MGTNFLFCNMTTLKSLSPLCDLIENKNFKQLPLLLSVYESQNKISFLLAWFNVLPAFTIIFISGLLCRNLNISLKENTLDNDILALLIGLVSSFICNEILK